MAIDLNELATAIGQLTLRFRLRRRTAAEWTSLNEVLLGSEIGLESDTLKVKMGDGSTAWNSLSYWSPGINSIVAGTGVTVDNTDPKNPIINSSGGGGGGSISPDDPPSSPNAMDDEFNGSSLDSKWVWVQQHTASASVGKGRLHFVSELTTANYLNAIEQTIPSGNSAYVVKLSGTIPSSGSFIFLQLRDSTGGNCRGFGFYNSGGSSVTLIVASGSLASGYTAVPTSTPSSGVSYCPVPAYLKIELTSTNYICSVSSDGIAWQLFGSYTISGSFAARPDKIGIGTRNASSSVTCDAVVDYFRRIS